MEICKISIGTQQTELNHGLCVNRFQKFNSWINKIRTLMGIYRMRP